MGESWRVSLSILPLESKKAGKPFEQVVECIVDLPTSFPANTTSSAINNNSTESSSEVSEFSLNNSTSLMSTTNSTVSARTKLAVKPASLSTSKEKPPLSRSSEMKVSPTSHVQSFQAWHHVDLKERTSSSFYTYFSLSFFLSFFLPLITLTYMLVRIISWQGFLILFLAFLIGIFVGR
jgi:hypothetical protein